MIQFLADRGGTAAYKSFSRAFPGVKKPHLAGHFVLVPEGCEDPGGPWQVALPSAARLPGSGHVSVYVIVCSPNSFLRSALFSAIQSKDREYLEGATLFSQQGITVKFTGRQLNCGRHH